MDKTRLTAFGERLKIGSEHLKVGSAEMGRKFSGKMKSILKGSSLEAKMVEEATSDGLEEPNWGLNLRICNLLNSEEFDGSEVVRAIKKRITGKSSIGQRLSLELLETCAMNCEKVFSEVASEKVLEEMVKMIDNPQTQYRNRQAALQLIEAWSKLDDISYLPVFKQTYMNLKSRNASNEQESGSFDHFFPSPKDDFGEHASSSIHGSYLLPRSGQHTTGTASAPLQGISLSNEEKRELLVTSRNSLELFSSLLNTESNERSLKDELLTSMVEKCRESQTVLRRIIETTTDDESLLFEALNQHDEFEQALTNYYANTELLSSQNASLAAEQQEAAVATCEKEGLKASDDTKGEAV